VKSNIILFALLTIFFFLLYVGFIACHFSNEFKHRSKWARRIQSVLHSSNQNSSKIYRNPSKQIADVEIYWSLLFQSIKDIISLLLLILVSYQQSHHKNYTAYRMSVYIQEKNHFHISTITHLIFFFSIFSVFFFSILFLSV
jgi:hypothetical protein